MLDCFAVYVLNKTHDKTTPGIRAMHSTDSKYSTSLDTVTMDDLKMLKW